MRFINVWVLAVLPLVLAFVMIMAVTAVSRRRAALRTLYGKAGYADKIRLSRFRRQVRYLVLFVLLAVLALAAARPWWGEIRSDVAGRGSDVVFVLDVSKSMLAEDASPSRLAHAKFLIRQIVKDNPDDRFALVLFAGDALLACPLTSDGGSFDMAVDEATVDSIPVGGTNVQRALQLVVKAFSGAETASRAVVMITDGEQLDGNATSVLAQLESSKIPLFVLGVGSGTEAATIPLRDNSGGVYTMLDRSGNAVKTKLNEALLQELASGANGRYFHAGNVATNLDALNRELAKVGTSSYTDNNKPQPIERFLPFVALAALLLTGFIMISERPHRLLAVLLMAVSMAAWADDAAPASASAPAAVATGVDPAIHTPAASAAASGAKPENWELYQRARDEQVEGEADKAREDYESALQSDGERQELVSSYSYHNLGVLEHVKSRGGMKEARAKLREQNPDAALKSVDDSLHKMDSAEEFYLNALRNGSVTGADTAAAQQLLLLDRSEAQKLKKEIEELKKRQEQAKKDAQNAKQQNSQQQGQQQNQQNQQGQQGQQQEQQQNQQGQQQEQQQNQQGQQGQQGQQQEQQQNQQNQQGQQGQQGQQQEQQQNQQGQQGQQQDKQQQSEAAQKAAEQAEKSSDELKEQADKLGQNDLKQRADRAKNELNKARGEQEKGNYDQAAKNLQNALDELNASSGKPGEQNKDDQQKQQDDKSGGNDDQKQQKQKERPGESPKPESGSAAKSNAQDGKPQAQQKIDPDMADAMLKMLNGDERDSRRRLEQRRRGGAPQTVEKDW